MTDWPSPYRVAVKAAMSEPASAALQASQLYHVGLTQYRSGNLAKAESAFRQALAIDDHLAGAHSHLAVVLQALHRPDQAIQHHERALALEPANIHALNNFANTLLALNRLDDAIQQYEKALAIAPDLADLHVNFANALDRAHRHEQAIRHYNKAIAIAPSSTRAHVSLGDSLTDLERHDEAIACYQRALVIEPNHILALTNLGKTLEMAERRQDSIACYQRVLASEPGNADARVNLGALHLSLGRLAEGWDFYEARWAVEGAPTVRAYPQPLWNGERLPGTLLAWADQGIGDQVLYAGMIPELAERVGQIVLEVEPRLVPLLARSFPAVRMIGLEQQLHAGRVDAHVPLSGLGKFLRPTLEAFARRSYLVADDARVRALRSRLTADRRIVVGLSWLSINPKYGRARSARLRDFEAVLRLPGCRFVDLQYGDTQAERAAVERDIGIRVERLDDVDNTGDIDGLAALLSACDAVVTIDNTTVHLAGALGRPTWVLVPPGRARIWYWFEGRDDSLWYPHVRVRRQLRGQAWAEVISAVATELARSFVAD